MDTISKRKLRLSLLPSSSQLRYAIAYILITTVALFILNIYASTTTRSMVFRAQKKSQADKAELMVAALLQSDELTPTKTLQTVASLENLHTTRTVVTDAGGVALYDSLEIGNAEGKTVLFPEIVDAMSGNDIFYGVYQNGAVECRTAMPIVRDGAVLGTVYLMEYDYDQGALISVLETNVLRISAALEGLVILFSLFFSTAFSRRVRRILYSVKMMRDGDYTHKLRLRGHDEIDRLGREFNNLAERLNDSEERRRQFVSDASHELKTPLASIKLLSDSILQNEMDVETQREFIGDIGREADRLGRLSQKLLMLTKLDSAVEEEEREIIDAARTVRKVARMLQPLADLRQITLEIESEDGCQILTMEDDFYQIVFNLTENAIKYNRDGGWVGITLQRVLDNVILMISDNGVGIPEEAREHIFERFYRVDKARSRAAGGAGLGLSIVHDMVIRNFGTIQVSARAGGGTLFSVQFPLFDTEEEPT